MGREFSLLKNSCSLILGIKKAKQSRESLFRFFYHRNNFHSAFTLIELVIVIVLIGVLASVAVPQFAVTKERALDREAISILGLIRDAERAYKMEDDNNEYYPNAASPSLSTPGNTVTINTELRLNLPANSSWIYTLTNGVATAVRTVGPRPRTLRLDAADPCDVPTCGGAGCFSAGGCLP